MSEAGAPLRPAVVVISSHVARGSVGNRAIVFALESLGFPVWSVPTVTLPWHPGHGPAPRIVPSASDFSEFMEALSSSKHLGEVGAVVTGYLGAAEQAVVALNRREGEIEAQREGDREKQESAKSGFAAAVHVSAFNRLLVDVPPV